ncbi:MAG: type II secretion system F family protein [Propionibacteriales bacterium]|nr:type II secretion system F family protein [Propionibacteriales bacterium]
MTGVLLGLMAGIGLMLVINGWARGRTPAIADRIDPYLRDIIPLARTHGPAAGILGPMLRRAAHLVGQTLGGTASVRRRLIRLSSTMSIDQFRMQQVMWGLTGFGSCAAVSALLYARGTVNVLPLLVLCCLGFIGGVLARDQALTGEVRRHEARLAEEFPTVADLLALAVAAGEGPAASLDRVVRVCHGELAVELDRVLGSIRTGTPLVRAFDDLAARTGVPTIARFAEGLAVAVERGTPLVDVLHAQAADVREATRRELIEVGGRKEVAMMIPVVFLILPVTIVFAFFPGFIGLHLTSGF